MGPLLIVIGIFLFFICAIVVFVTDNMGWLIGCVVGLLTALGLIIGGSVIKETVPEPYLVSECIEYVSNQETFYRVRLFNQDTDKIIIIYIYPEQLDKYKFEVGGTVELSESQLNHFMKQED